MIHGIGSMYGGKQEMLPKFVAAQMACIGWDKADAAPLHQMLATSIQVGDILYIKSQTPSDGLFIKAVGIVLDSEIYNHPELGFGRKVHWVWVSKGNPEFIRLGKQSDKYDNIRAGSLYPEYGEKVQKVVLKVVFDHLQ